MRKYLSLSRLKSLQALFTVLGTGSLLLFYASSNSTLIDGFLIRQTRFLPVWATWNPFSLPILIAVSRTLQLRWQSLWLMTITVGVASGLALAGSEWLTRDGLVDASGLDHSRDCGTGAARADDRDQGSSLRTAVERRSVELKPSKRQQTGCWANQEHIIHEATRRSRLAARVPSFPQFVTRPRCRSLTRSSKNSPLSHDLHRGFWLCGRRCGSYPETLVLYRMRPIVDARVDLLVVRGASDTAV